MKRIEVNIQFMNEQLAQDFDRDVMASGQYGETNNVVKKAVLISTGFEHLEKLSAILHEKYEVDYYMVSLF